MNCTVPKFISTYNKSGKKGLVISLWVQTQSSRTGPLGVYGQDGEYLRWGLSSAPVEGQANKELVKSIAKYFKGKKSQVRILSGESSRKKLILLEEFVVSDSLWQQLLNEINEKNVS